MASTVGKQLQQERIRRELTLEQVSQAIYVRKHYLEALENDQHDTLPSAVQGRGFLRLYAGLLELPIEPLLDAWDRKAPLPGEEPGEAAGDSALSERQAVAPDTESAVPPPSDPLELVGPPAPVPVEFQTDTSSNGNESGSRAVFIEVGEKLRQQREALGISRAEVERYTRLRQHYLQALEEGRIDALPSPVQGRGMLSNYAAFLNLDEEALLLRFAEGLQTRRIERMPPPEPQPVFNKRRPARQVSPLRRFLTPDLIFGVVVVVAILFFAGRTAISINKMRAQEAQPTTRAISEVLLTPSDLTITPGGTADATAVSTALAGELNIEGTQPAETPLPPVEGNAGGGLPPANPLPSTDLNTTVTATLPPINSDPLQIYIVARERAFLRITVDNKVQFNGRVVPGNAYAFSGTKRIDLLSGDASALQVFYNQKDLGTLGITGEVLNLMFVPEEGMITPTPAPTATATITPTPTATSQTPQAGPTITPLIPKP